LLLRVPFASARVVSSLGRADLTSLGNSLREAGGSTTLCYFRMKSPLWRRTSS
jgi:hypothetical protein